VLKEITEFFWFWNQWMGIE